MKTIHSEKLTLIATRLEHVLAELEPGGNLSTLLGVYVPQSWPTGEYDRDAMEFFRDRLEAGGEKVVGWYGWYAIRPATAEIPATLVGGGGYFGPPDKSGIAEIGYAIVPECRLKGYATELIRLLVEQAFEFPEVIKVIAHTDVTNIGSHKSLINNGFVHTDTDSDGQMRFERHRVIV